MGEAATQATCQIVDPGDIEADAGKLSLPVQLIHTKGAISRLRAGLC
jgi:hypothetical protein